MKRPPVTQEQVLAAVDVFLLTAMVQVIQPIIENIQMQVLQADDYPVEKDFDPTGVPAQYIRERLVKHPKADYRIAGIMKAGTPEYAGTPAEKYFIEIGKRAEAAGLVHKENACAVLENELREAEYRFMKLCDSLHNIISIDEITRYQDRKEYLRLNMGLFAQDVQNYVDRDKLQRKLYSKYVNQAALTLNDEWKLMQNFLTPENAEN